MSPERAELEAAIETLQAQRETLGDEVVDMAVAPLQAKLAAYGTAAGSADGSTLKQVTILFVDVVGSTEIGSRLDPEDIHAFMDQVLRRLTSVTERHEGRVFNYTGDGLLAVFGAAGSQEESAENAVRAGLAVLEDTHRLAGELTDTLDLRGLNVRVGADTGRVLLGGGVEGEHNIRGSAVNLAARMEQSAPAGGLRITHNTYRQVRGLFDVTEEPAIQVKGIEEPVRTYLVLRAKPRAFRVATRGIEDLETRMVGRNAELSSLKDAFDALHKGRLPRSVTIIAEAGVGKSRLLYEFENWAEVQGLPYRLFKGRGQPHARQQPYGLLRDVLAWRFQIADTDSQEMARHKLVAGLQSWFADDDEAPVHLLGHLIGMDFSSSPHVRGILTDPQQIRSRGFHAAARFFRSMAATSDDGAPVLLVLEDLHWADDGTLDFLSYLAEADRDIAMLVIASARPSLLDRRPRWIEDLGSARIDLGPLGREDTRELASVLLQKLDVIPTVLAALLTSGGDGNPFFMEEIVRMLLDEGAIVTTDIGTWHVAPERLLSVRVPPTLMGVLQARLDALSPQDRVALQVASVVGFLFSDEAMEALDLGSTRALEGLVRRGFVVAQPADDMAGAREYTFQHHLLHQFTYDSMLKRERRDHHARAAAWLAGMAARRGAEHHGATGEHYERAGATAEAVDYYTRAAESAAARDAREAALDYVARALALAADDSHATRWRLLATREGLLALQDDRAVHFANLTELDVIADALDDDARRAEASLRRMTAHLSVGEYRKAETVGRHALALAERAGSTIVAVRAYGQLGLAVRRMGMFAEARQLAERGLALASIDGDRLTEGAALNCLGTIVTEQGDLVTGDVLTSRALSICRETEDRVREADLLNRLGDNRIRLGDYEAAEGHFLESLGLARQLGWIYSESLVHLNLAAIAHLRGQHDRAITSARAAAHNARAAGARDLEAASHLPLGLAEAALGRWEAARTALTLSRDLFELNDGPHLALEPVAGLALIRLAEGDPAGAVTEVEEILRHLSAGGQLEGTEEPFRIRLSCYRVLSQAGDRRANAVLGETHDALQAQAVRILDADARRRYLHDVPHHDAICTAWAAHDLERA